jgi:Tol biopolymer transport system component
MVHEQLAPAPRGIWRIPGRRSSVANRRPEKLIVSRWNDFEPAYSPNGHRIAFTSDRSGVSGVWLAGEDGANPVQVTPFDAPSWGWAPWSPDGRRIVFLSGIPGKSRNPDVYIVDSDGGVPRRLTREPTQKSTATFSRDGRFIYYSSDRSGAWQIWKVPAEGGLSVQVTRGGGFAAQESWDARYFYYSKAPSGGGLWRVPVEGGEEAPVFSAQPAFWTQWALSPAGIYWARDALSILAPTSQGRSFWREDYTIHFFDFQSGRSQTLFRKVGLFNTLFLTVSPDEKWILFSEAPVVQSELMLVENFR